MRTPSRLLPVLMATMAGAAVLTGCGGDEDPASPTAGTSATAPDASASTSSVSGGGSSTDEDGGTEATPFPADAAPDTAAPSADALVSLTDIRVGRHDGFDRVVFETDGTGSPGWDVRYVEEASSQGSGDPVEVGGEEVLQVTLTGTGYPYDTGVEEYPRGAAGSAEGAVNVSDVVFDGTFEGQSVAFIGTSSQTPFRVYLLEEPSRVVVEVADRG